MLPIEPARQAFDSCFLYPPQRPPHQGHDDSQNHLTFTVPSLINEHVDDHDDNHDHNHHQDKPPRQLTTAMTTIIKTTRNMTTTTIER